MYESGNNMGMTTPPLRVNKAKNVCNVCAHYWAMNSVMVPTDLPASNPFCPVKQVNLLGLVPCLKVDDLDQVVEQSDDLALDLMLIDDYPMDMSVVVQQQQPRFHLRKTMYNVLHNFM